MPTSSRLPRAMRVLALKLLVVATPFFCSACGAAGSDSEGRALPADKQVIADITPSDRENVVDVRVVEGREGEAYLHKNDLVWYFDRGAVIKRKADLAGVPDAVLVVGGLARYQLVGDRYEYRRFLTTYNEYEGIPAPGSDELTAFVEARVGEVFVGREHNIVDVADLRIDADTPWTWHSPASFSAPFHIHYTQRSNNTTLEERADVFDIRFYRKTINDPLHALLATEKSRSVLGQKTLSAQSIDEMKTLRTNFQ